MRKPVFVVSDQVIHKFACSATETTKNIAISLVAILDTRMILSIKRITKALIRLRGCAVWYAPLLSQILKTVIFAWRPKNEQPFVY